MAFPTIPTVAASRILFTLNTAGGATKTFPNLSSLTKSAGDLLIAICVEYDGNSTNAEFSAWGGGFTEFADQAGTATMAIGCAYKVSTGSETGTFTVTTADTSANDSVLILMSIPGANAVTAPEAGTMAVGTAPDSGSLNPAGWDAEDTLWISVGASGEDSISGTYTGIGTAPTNYGSQADSGITADAVGGVEASVAFRQLNAASEDPGTWSMDTSNARGASLLIAVRPAVITTKQEITQAPFSGGGVSVKNTLYSKANQGTVGPYYRRWKDDTFSTATTSNTFGIPSTERVAQKFQLTSAASRFSVKSRMRLVGSPSDDVRVGIQADASGSPSDTFLDSAVVDVVADASYTVTLNVALSANTDYWVVWERTGALDAGNAYGIYLAVSPYDSPITGKAYGSGAWSSAGTNKLFLVSGNGFVASGVAFTGVYTKAGAGISAFSASAADATAFARTGTGVNGGLYARPTPTGNASWTFGRTVNAMQAQSFTPVVDGTLVQIISRLSASGTPTDDVSVEIRADSSGSPAGSALASKAVDVTSGTSANYTATFSLALTAGTTYWVVWSRTGASSDTNFYNLLTEDPGRYSSGGISKTFTGAWTTQTFAPILDIVLNGASASGADAKTINKTGIAATGASYRTPSVSPIGTLQNLGADTSGERHGMSFTLKEATDRVTISSVLVRTGTPADHVRISVQADSSGAPSGTPLGSATLDPTVQALYSVTFAASLSANTTYWVVWERTGAVNGTNYYSTGRSASSSDAGTSGRTLWRYNSATPAWVGTAGAYIGLAVNGNGDVASGDDAITYARAGLGASNGGALVGNDVESGLADGIQNFVRVSQFTAPSAFVIRTGAAKLQNSSGAPAGVRLVVYSDSAGSPGTLLAQSDETLVAPVGVGQTTTASFAFSTPVYIASGQIIWIGAHSGTANVFLSFTSGGTSATSNTDSYADGAASTFSVGGTGTNKYAGWLNQGFAAIAADEITSAESGAGTSGFAASGTSQKIAGAIVKAGAGISDGFVASGGDATTYVEAGAGVSVFSGGAPTADTHSKAGLAAAVFTGTGSDAITYVETGTARADTPNPLALPILDDFNRANETPLSGGGNWLALGTASRPRLISNAVDWDSATSRTRYFPTFGPNVGMSIRVAGATKIATLFAVLQNGSSDSFSGYSATFSDSEATEVLLQRVDAGVTTQLGNRAMSSGWIADGDRLSLTHQDGVVRVHLNGTVLFNVADSTYVGDGDAIGQVGFGTSDVQTIDDFAAGNITTSTGFSGDGADAVVYVETGAGVSAFVANGADAGTSAETGSGVSAFTASGARNSTAIRTGTGISPFVASGWAPALGITYVETGIAVMGAIGAAIYAEQNVAIAPFAASGADATTFAETGAATSALTASGAKQVTYGKAGAGISAFVASGSDAPTYAETGAGIAPFTVLGARNNALTRAGAGVSSRVASGADSTTYAETGAGISAFVANGADAVTSAETGIGIAPFAVLGDAVSTLNRTGAGISNNLIGSGADVDTFAETGAAISNNFIASGDATTATVKLGTGTSAFSASGADATTSAETGAGISPRTVLGDANSTTAETGAGIANNFVGSGADAVTSTETGSATSAFVGSGVDAVTSAEAGAGIAPFSASGSRSKTSAQAGSATSAFSASGADATTYAETGAAVAPFVASGTKSRTSQQSGAGIAPFSASGADATTSSDAGTAIAPFSASGADAITSSEAGSATSAFVAAADGRWALSRTGAGILDNLVGASADTDVFSDTGAGVAPFSASGSRSITRTKSGAGIAPLSASGSVEKAFTESGTAIAPFAASGNSATQFGATYAKVGAGIADFTASGSDATTQPETGAGILDATASGTRSVEHAHSGTATSAFSASGTDVITSSEAGTCASTFVASGADAITSSESGTGTAPFSASGARARTSAQSGTGTSAFVGSGADAVTSAETGSATAPFAASGADSTASSDTGAGVMPHVADADGRWVVADAGTGIVGTVASGAVAKQGEPIGTGTSGFAGTGDAQWTLNRTGTGSSPRTGSIADSFSDVDAGAAVAPFSAAGSRAVEHLRTGTAISALAASADAQWTLSRSGVGIAPFDNSATPVYALNKSGTGIVGTSASGTTARAGAVAGAATSGFAASGTRSLTRQESGTGIVDLASSGSFEKTASRTGAGIVSFVALATAAVERQRSGVGFIEFFASGEEEQALERTGTGIIVFVGEGARRIKLRKGYGRGNTILHQGGSATTVAYAGSGTTEGVMLGSVEVD